MSDRFHDVLGQVGPFRGSVFIISPMPPDSVDHIGRDYCSDASILGVADGILVFSGGGAARTDAGMTPGGQGQASARTLRDVVELPGTLTAPTVQEDGKAPQPAAEVTGSQRPDGRACPQFDHA